MGDREQLARLDRISLLLVALLGVELWDVLHVDLLGIVLVLVAVLVFGFAFLWGKSVFGLLFEENI